MPGLSSVLLAVLLLAPVRSGPDGVQQLPVRFEQVTIADGLSQSSIYAITQDHDGFLWFGTQDGLNRYDGYTFTVYKHDPDDANSLTDNFISAVHEGRDGVLWVGTMQSGLNRLDPYSGRVEHYRHAPGDTATLGSDTVRSLAEDADGGVWVGTWGGGLARLDPRTGAAERFAHDAGDATTLGSDVVADLLVDRRGELWAGTGRGLSRFDAATRTFETYLPATDTDGWRSNFVREVYEDRSGTLWIATGRAYYTFDRAAERFTRLDIGAPSDEMWAPTAIYEDGSGVVWLGSTQGLICYRPDGGDVIRIAHNPSQSGSLGAGMVSTLFEDRSGVLWIGSSVGLNKVDRDARAFGHLQHDPNDANSLSSNMVASVLKDRTGAVWVGTWQAGLNRIDPRTGDVTHYRHQPGQPNSLSSNGIWALHEDAAGYLWVGTTHALDRLDPQTGQVTRYPLDGTGLPGYASIRAIAPGPEETLWVGTQGGGLSRFDPDTGRFTRYGDAPADSAGLGDDRVTTLLPSPDGSMWVGTVAGLHHFDPATETFRSYTHDPDDPHSLAHNWVLSIHRQPDGSVWVGTFGGGLGRLDPATGRFRRYTEQNSDLPTNTVIGVVGGGDGALWLSTHRGIARFDPLAETFRVYDGGRGLQSREFNFGAFHRSDDGEIFFGGINGVNAFYPDQMTDNPHPPEVVLTDLRIQNRSVAGPESEVLEAPLPDADTVTLSHDQNDLTFEYVGLHYADPARNRYAYMLERYDDGWREAGTQRTAAYTNLDPGTYTFRVRAASQDGVWNEVGTALRVVIHPPWWRTVWAYLGYALVLAFGILVVDRVQRRRLIRRERARAHLRMLEAEHERQAQELEEARQLQLSMLPKHVPDHPAFAIAAYMRTATEVGGDYYDFHVADDGTLTVAIGDATGHGANAGTMVTAAKSLFNVLASEEDPLRMLRRYTRALKRLHLPKLYMALALAKVRPDELEIVGAGMPPALVYRAATGRVDEIPLKGMPLGSFVDFPYQKHAVPLAPGDTVLLMSDGFPELFNGAGEMYGYERARQAFAAVAGEPPETVVERLTQQSRHWVDGTTNGAANGSATPTRDDDMTFVVLQRRVEETVASA